MSDRRRKSNPSLDFEIKFYEGVVKRSPDYVDALIPLAEAYTKTGRYQEGLKIDQRLSLLCKEDPIVHYNLACSLALSGKKTEAIVALKKSMRLGYKDMRHLKKDADLKGLHEMPEFKKIAGDL